MTQCEIVTVTAQPAAVVRRVTPMAELRGAQESARVKLNAELPQVDAGAVGKTLTLFRPPENGAMDYAPGNLVTKEFTPVGDVTSVVLPAGRAAHFKLVGGFENLGDAWGTLFGWIGAQKLQPAGPCWEIYGETAADPTKQETDLYALLA